MNCKRFYDSIQNNQRLDKQINGSYTYENESSLLERVGNDTRFEDYDFLINKIKQEDPEDFSFLINNMGLDCFIDDETGTNIYFLKISNYG